MKLFSALLGFSQVSAFDVNEHVEGYCKATQYVNAHPGTEYINIIDSIRLLENYLKSLLEFIAYAA